jgi:hypothetical protein
MAERTTSAASPADRHPTGESRAAHREKLLDDALAETFPASDPLAIIAP